MAGWQRAEREDISIPFLIVPRATVVLTNQPVIQWHPVQGANTYRIVVRGEDLSRSERVSAIANPQLIYSPDAPALSPGVPYTVEIIASLDGGKTVSSAEEGVPNTSFTVMTPEEADEIQAVVEAIRAEVGNIVVAHLAVAHLYAQNSLHAEALLTLADVTGDFIESGCASISQADETPVVYQMLGDLYMETGVELYATVAYSCALDLAAQSGDQESQALASAALARLVLDEGLRTEYVASAIQLWHQLGAQVHIDALQAEFEYEGE